MVVSEQGNGKVLGPLEAEVMKVLWAAGGPVPVRDVLDKLNAGREPPLAYTTVMTVMRRLAEKNILSRRAHGRGYAYQPVVSDVAEIAVRDVLRNFGDAAVAHFAEEARADPEIRARLRGLLEDG